MQIIMQWKGIMNELSSVDHLLWEKVHSSRTEDGEQLSIELMITSHLHEFTQIMRMKVIINGLNSVEYLRHMHDGSVNKCETKQSVNRAERWYVWLTLFLYTIPHCVRTPRVLMLSVLVYDT